MTRQAIRRVHDAASNTSRLRRNAGTSSGFRAQETNTPRASTFSSPFRPRLRIAEVVAWVCRARPNGSSGTRRQAMRRTTSVRELDEWPSGRRRRFAKLKSASRPSSIFLVNPSLFSTSPIERVGWCWLWRRCFAAPQGQSWGQFHRTTSVGRFVAACRSAQLARLTPARISKPPDERLLQEVLDVREGEVDR